MLSAELKTIAVKPTEDDKYLETLVCLETVDQIPED